MDTPGTPDGVRSRLEEAMEVMARLHVAGVGPAGTRSAHPEIASASASYDFRGMGYRPVEPNASEVTRMDEALSWLGLIPQRLHILRRIVMARSVVRPSGTSFHSYADIGKTIGAPRKAVQRWHEQGLAIIARSLNRAG